MPPLHERYDELMTYRREGLAKYGASRWYQIYGPPSKIRVPAVAPAGSVRRRNIRIGPLAISEIPAVEGPVKEAIAGWRSPGCILELGPGRGELAEQMLQTFGSNIRHYYGLDRDAGVAGSYRRVATAADISEPIDLVIASEVAEHMPADDFAAFLDTYRSSLAPGATLVASVPNVLAPGGIDRDFTHAQGWPWYDLYALLRLSFSNVAVYRTYHLCGLSRLLMLPLRIALTRALELDWCEALLFVARSPVG